MRGYDFYTISPFVEIPYATNQPVTFFNPTVLNQQGTADAANDYRAHDPNSYPRGRVAIFRTWATSNTAFRLLDR